jgi:hypothetical protein
MNHNKIIQYFPHGILFHDPYLQSLRWQEDTLPLNQAARPQKSWTIFLNQHPGIRYHDPQLQSLPWQAETIPLDHVARGQFFKRGPGAKFVRRRQLS